jgi:hypothetical protein
MNARSDFCAKPGIGEHRLTPDGPWSVIVIDTFHYGDDTFVRGFPTEEIATEYARRRARDSLEEQHGAGTSAEELKRKWYAFGEDCSGAARFRRLVAAHPADPSLTLG